MDVPPDYGRWLRAGEQRPPPRQRNADDGANRPGRTSLSHRADGISPQPQRPGGNRTDLWHLMNALAHRSGLEAYCEGPGTAFLPGWNQQPEFPDARSRDGIMVATGDGARDLRSTGRQHARIAVQ